MKKAQTQWTPIYLLIVLIIAAVLIFTFKRTITGAQDSASGNLDSARDVTKNLVNFLILSKF